ncbi:unnamed protein product [Closterium sp. Naga37s-1]|nr:unnamed protein product [Closterium sp. Naga37s-1]
MATHLQPSFAASHVSSAVPLHTSPPQVCAFPLTFPRIPPASAVRIPSPCALSRVLFRGAPSPTRIRSPPKRAAAARAAAKGEPPASGGDPALAAAAWKALVAVRRSRPLVHCITNFVSMDAAANTLLAAGAAPAMVHSLEEVRWTSPSPFPPSPFPLPPPPFALPPRAPQVEDFPRKHSHTRTILVEEFASLASALYVNIGTLSPDWVDSMKRAAKVISARNRPWVLDPVGCGATSYRTKTSAELLALRPTVVRGNASEVLALAGAVSANTRAPSARTPGAFQPSLLQAITATGCSVTALIAAFLAASAAAAAAAAAADAAADVSLPLLASACALDVYG